MISGYRRDLPAMLGGTPAFSTSLPIVRPLLPPFRRVEADFRQVLSSGRLSNFGPFSQALEEQMSRLLNVENVISVASCTVGLGLVLSTVPRGKEAILPSFTFGATLDSVLASGLVPVFADIDPRTLTMDTACAERLVSDKTGVVIPVHVFGNPCDTKAFDAFTKRTQIPVVYDSAHAMGSLHDDKPVGGSGRAEVFSLSATKLLPAGEGGLIALEDGQLAEWLRRARNYGLDPLSDLVCPGTNGKMTELACVLALHGMKELKEAVTRRNSYAALYRDRLAAVSGVSFQEIRDGDVSNCKDFAVLVDKGRFRLSRDMLLEALKAEHIEVRPYFSPPLHLTSLGRALSSSWELRNTEDVARRVLCLPIHSLMETDDVERVCGAIIRIQMHAEQVRSVLGGVA